jgi:hypothetical protein
MAIDRGSPSGEQREANMTAAVSVQDESRHGQRRHDKYDQLVATAQLLP